MIHSQKTKSILLVGWFFYPKLGGVESIMLNQAKYLIGLGYKVSVLTSSIRDCPDDEIYENIKIFRRDYINSGICHNPAQIINDVSKIYDSERFEIAHFHNGSYPSASNDMIAGGKNIITLFNYFRSKQVILVDHAHNAQLKNPSDTKQLRDLDWDCLICVSDFVVTEWKKLGFKTKKIVRIYNGIKLENYNHVKPTYNFRNSKGTVILFPARVISMSKGEISKQKNFRLIIAALNELVEEKIFNFKLVAVLNESQAKENNELAYTELAELIRKLQSNNLIQFIDEVQSDEMPGLYASVDAICVPSIKETFGLVYLEAMASGKIAIASNTGGPREYIKDGIDGFLVDTTDPKDLINTLKSIILDETGRKKIIECGYRKAQEFSFEKFISSIINLYNDLEAKNKK